MKKRTLLTLLYLGFTTIPIFSQVLIGGNEKPTDGAILQLKNIEGSTDGITADKGLALPRVNLSEPDKLFPMYSYADDENTPTEEDMNRHTGLVVYNTNETELMCHGLYVWKKNKWQGIGTGITDYLVDRRTKIDGSIEEHTYPIRDFGEAGIWMVSNLRATTYADNIASKAISDLILSKNSGSNRDMKAYYYPLGGIKGSTPEEDKKRFQENAHWGLMYSWTAAMNAEKTDWPRNEGEGIAYDALDDTRPGAENPNPLNIEEKGPQGVCPEGWHLPSDREMNTLEKILSNDQSAKYYTGIPVDGIPYRPEPWEDAWRYVQGNKIHRGTHSIAMMSSYENDELFEYVPRYRGQARKNCDGSGGFATYQLGFMASGASAGSGMIGDYWTASMASSDEAQQPGGAMTDARKYRAWYRSIYTGTAQSAHIPIPSVHRRTQDIVLLMNIRCKKN